MKDAFSYKRKITVIISTMLLCTVFVFLSAGHAAHALANSGTDISGENPSISYMIYETETKQTLQRLNADAPTDCSTLARLMTCLIVLESDTVSVTDYITPQRNSVSASERYELLSTNQYMIDHLIKSVILCNADNSARVLAAHISPDAEYFVSLMNKKAAELGMTNTYFTNVDGTQDEIQRTTVNDMTLFWSYAMGNTQFRNAASSPVTHIWGGTAVVNECRLLRNASFNNASLTAGVYTMYDSDTSLGTTMFYITTGASNTSLPPTRLTLVMTGVSDEYAYELGVSYIENALINFVKSALIERNGVVTTVKIDGGELILVANESIYCMMPSDVTNYIDNISYNITLENASPSQGNNSMTLSELSPPIAQGTVIGTANYMLKDGSVHQVTISAGNTIRSDNKTVNIFYKTIQENTDIFILVSVLAAFEFILILCALVSKIRKHKKTGQM